MAQKIRFDVADREIEGDDYFVVIEPVFLSVSIYDGPDRYEEDLAQFSNEQRLVLAYHWYLSDVNNGGHDQFYYNSTGIVWRDALKAFVAISVDAVAAIIEASARRSGGNPSLDREERQRQLDQMNPDSDDLWSRDVFGDQNEYADERRAAPRSCPLSHQSARSSQWPERSIVRYYAQ
jgi:hypothetical protein